MSLGRRPQKMSQSGERRMARQLGGRVQPGSGNGRFAKGDIKAGEVLIERKDTQAASYVLKLADLDKLAAHANKAGKDAVFVVSFSGRDFAIVPFVDLVDP